MQKYWNLISTLFKRSSHSYFTKFFQEHIKDFKNAWKVIKSFISLKLQIKHILMPSFIVILL